LAGLNFIEKKVEILIIYLMKLEKCAIMYLTSSNQNAIILKEDV